MSVFDIGEEAWFNRANDDATLITLLTGGGRILHGWPGELLDNPQESEYPRITYFGVTDQIERPGLGEMTVQADIWVWDDIDLLKSLYNRLEDLFLEQWWTDLGKRINCHRMQSSGDPSGAQMQPLHRTVDFRIGVS